MISVISSGGCVGFVLSRRHQWQAYTADCRSLGFFPTQQAAIDVVLKHGEADQAA